MSADKELPYEETDRWAQLNDLKIHYNEAGTGDPLLMLHGGGPGASGWSNFPRNIGPLSDHFRVVLPDLPGFGRSDQVVISGSRSVFYARIIVSLMDPLRIRAVHLVGNSSGGATAVKIAADFPERVQRLILMGLAGMGPSTFAPHPSEGIRQLNVVTQNPTKEGLKRFLELCVYDARLIGDDLLEGRYQALMGQMKHQPKGGPPGPEDPLQDLPKI